MRRLIPFVLVAVLTLGAIIGATVSVQNSPRLVFFSQPPAGSANATHALWAAVEKSLVAPSFQEIGQSLVIRYQAPNKIEEQGGGPSNDEFFVGPDVLFRLFGPGAQWGEMAATPFLAGVAASVTGQLRSLLQYSDVHGSNGRYRAEEVVPAGDVVANQGGQMLLAATITTRNGYVRQLHVTVYGHIPRYRANVFGDTTTYVVHSTLYSNERYSRFGHINVHLPPSNEVARLVACSTRFPATKVDGQSFCTVPKSTNPATS